LTSTTLTNRFLAMIEPGGSGSFCEVVSEQEHP